MRGLEGWIVTELTPTASDRRPARAGTGSAEHRRESEGGAADDGPEGPPGSSAQTAVLYKRGSVANRDRERAVVEALETLSADGLIEEVELRTWPGRVSLEGAETGRSDLVETFETFRSWASEHGTSICPPFLVRERESAITSERDVVLVTPTMFLTVYDDDGLVDLYPREDDDALWTIDDWLAGFAGGTDSSAGAAASAGRVSESRLWRDRQPPTGGERTRR